MENLGSQELRSVVTEVAGEAVNLGYRMGDAVHRWREQRAVAHGREPIVVPSEGYGRVATDTEFLGVPSIKRLPLKNSCMWWKAPKIPITRRAGGGLLPPLPCRMCM